MSTVFNLLRKEFPSPIECKAKHLPPTPPVIDESAAEAAACLEFIKNEIVWLEWSAEFLQSDSAEQKNLVKLRQFVDKTGRGAAVLARIAELESELRKPPSTPVIDERAVIERCAAVCDEWANDVVRFEIYRNCIKDVVGFAKSLADKLRNLPPVGAAKGERSIPCKVQTHASDGRVVSVVYGNRLWEADENYRDARITWTDPEPPAETEKPEPFDVAELRYVADQVNEKMAGDSATNYYQWIREAADYIESLERKVGVRE